jgi:hypothetical protein
MGCVGTRLLRQADPLERGSCHCERRPFAARLLGFDHPVPDAAVAPSSPVTAREPNPEPNDGLLEPLRPG